MAKPKQQSPEAVIRSEQSRLKKDMIVWIEEWCQHWLTTRRMCGVPDPEQKQWSTYGTQYMLVWLMLYQQQQGQPVDPEMVPTELRDRLSDPVYEQPATDEQLRALSIHPPWEWRTLPETVLDLRGQRWRTREEVGELLGIVGEQLSA